MKVRTKQRKPSGYRVLIVEDKDSKYDAIAEILRELLPQSLLQTRACTVTEGEEAIERSNWDLVILDISMDIRGSSRGALQGGHANLGGLDIAEGMYLRRRTFPTIVLTGFDYFQSSSTGNRRELIGLSEIEEKGRKFLKSDFIACIRYGYPAWKTELGEALKVWRSR